VNFDDKITQNRAFLPSIAAHAREHGIIPNKKLGQNFLFDLSLCEKIARSAGGIEGKTILEVGPGSGGLTRAILLQNPKRLILIEKDNRCISLIEDIKKFYPQIELISGDALKIRII
jgi:16S rRNA (adenine1518-N6/adenine1519-N6)-dimethyltransferase